MRTRLGGWFDGTGWFVGSAIALFVFALLAVFLELQSPNSVIWTGHRIVGTEQGGIVSYRWDGQTYSLDAPGFGSARAVSVYLDPGDPGDARLNDPVDRTLTATLVGVPVIGGVAVLVAGLTRKSRWRRRQLRRGGPAADLGLSPDFVAEHLRELRQEHKNPQ